MQTYFLEPNVIHIGLMFKHPPSAERGHSCTADTVMSTRSLVPSAVWSIHSILLSSIGIDAYAFPNPAVKLHYFQSGRWASLVPIRLLGLTGSSVIVPADRSLASPLGTLGRKSFP